MTEERTNNLIPGLSTTLIDGFESGWAVPFGTATASHVADHAIQGEKTLKVQSQAGGEAYIQKQVTVDFSEVNWFSLDIYVESPSATGYSSAALGVYLLTSGSGSDYHYVTNITLRPGWNRVTLHRSQFSVNGTATKDWADPIQYLRFRLFLGVGMTWIAYFDNFRAARNRVQKPVIIIGNDDLWDTTAWLDEELRSYDEALSPSERMRATLYIATSLLGTENHCGEEDIPTFAAHGHAICSHTTSHTAMTTYTKQQTIDDVGPNLEFLRQYTDNGSELFFAYPFGAFNADVIAGLEELGVKMARTTLSPLPTSLDIDSPYLGLAFNFTASTTLANFVAWLDQVIALGCMGEIVTHRFPESNASGADVLRSLMKQIIGVLYRRIRAGQIQVRTKPDWYRSLPNP